MSRADALRRHAWPLTALLVLPAWIFRLHLTGASVYIGNFDRLNSHLNVLTSWVRAIRDGTSLGWDEVMFTGTSLYGLPYTFPNPLTYLLAIVDPSRLITAAGYGAVGLLLLAGWAAYTFIFDVCRQRVPALVGAALYQSSALALLKVSQNDMSFAVLIHIPILLLAVRHIGADRRDRFWVGLFACALTSLLLFTFLQKAAYTLLLVGAYCLYRAWRLASWKPVAALALAFTVALIVSGPRLMAVAEDFGQFSRPVEAGGSRDFAELYRFQNITPREFFRWFDDGIFGRFPAEARTLGNNVNLSEGLLLYTAQVAPFLLAIVTLRGRGQWLPLLRPTRDVWRGDLPFLAGVVLAVLAIVLVRPVAHLFFLAFMKVDFTHARVAIVALLPICALVACWLADAVGTAETRKPLAATALLAVAAIIGGALAWTVDRLGQRADGVAFQLSDNVAYDVNAVLGTTIRIGDALLPPSPASFSAARLPSNTVGLKWVDGPAEEAYRIEMSRGQNGRFVEIGSVPAGSSRYRVGDLASDETYSFRVRACGRAGCSEFAAAATVAPGSRVDPSDAYAEAAAPPQATWFHGGRVARVIWSGVAVGLLATGLWVARRRPAVRWVVAHGLAFMAVAQALAAADFRINGPYLDTPIPFQDGAFLRGAPGEFSVPSSQAREALRHRLENDTYRSVLICDRDTAPIFCAAHLSYFWNLRVVEGYSSGLPTRLVSLPWPSEVVSLRAISFITADQLPWPLLTMLNVRNVIRVDDALYRNRYAAESDVAKIEVGRAPTTVTPRTFFAASVVPAADLAGAVSALFPAGSASAAPEVTATSVVEGLASGASLSTEGAIRARYRRGVVDIAVTPATAPRFLVLNELFHPRWRAFSAGEELTVFPTNAVMRGVVVPPGVDNIRFEFIPAYRTATALPSACLGLILMAFGLRSAFWARSTGGRHDPMEAIL